MTDNVISLDKFRDMPKEASPIIHYLDVDNMAQIDYVHGVLQQIVDTGEVHLMDLVRAFITLGDQVEPLMPLLDHIMKEKDQ